MQRIIQAFPGIFYGDAVTNYLFELYNVFKLYGFESVIITEVIDRNLKEKDEYKIVNPKEIEIYTDDILIYHYSMPSSLAFILGNKKCKKIIIYHNVTPPVFFHGYSEIYEKECLKGRYNIKKLVSLYHKAWADSSYNASCLEKLGFNNVSIMPIPYKKNYNIIPNNFILNKYKENKNILFVGRISPNKKQEDIIKAFFYYHKIEPNSHLFLIGNYSGLEVYKDMLNSLIKSLKLINCIHMPGKVSYEDLEAYWQSASLFLSMSEHEGFCVPVLEALAHEVPVLAFASSAIPETLGNAGILFYEKNFTRIAEVMNAIIENHERVIALKAAGRKQIINYDPEVLGKLAISLINEYID